MKTPLLGRKQGLGGIAEDAAEGALAGVVATAAMSLFTAGILAALRRAGMPEREQERLARKSPEGGEPTEKAAEVVEKALARRQPTRREKRLGGAAIHWTFGAVLGVVYGVLARRGKLGAAAGLGFGAVVFAGASEAALPALGLSLPASTQPPAGRAINLVSHLIYGAALDATARGLRAAVG